MVQVQARRMSPRITEPFALPPESLPTCAALMLSAQLPVIKARAGSCMGYDGA